MTPERIDELIALAALGELSVQEERELDEAARLDPTVDAELAEALETAAAIQRTGAEDPPAGLRDGVLAAIRDTPQERVDGSAARTPRPASSCRSPAPVAAGGCR